MKGENNNKTNQLTISAVSTESTRTASSSSAGSAIEPINGSPKTSRRLLLLTVLSASFGFNLTLQILTVSLPDIQQSFNTTDSIVSWVSLAPSLTSVVIQPLAGAISDRYGAVPVWFSGVCIVTGSIIISAMSSSIGMLIAARALTGFGTGLTVPAGLALISLSYRKAERAKPLSLQVTTLNAASAIGMVLSGLLAQFMSWQYIFYMQVPFALITLSLGIIQLRLHLDRQARRRAAGSSATETKVRSVDYAGCLAFSVATFSLVFFINMGQQVGWSSAIEISFIILAVLSLGFFIWIEGKVKSPFMPPFVFKDSLIRLTFLIRWCTTSMYFGAFIILPYYFRHVLGCSAVVSALVLMARIVTNSAVAYMLGNVLNRSRYANLVRGSCFFFLLSNLMFVFLTDKTPLVYIVFGNIFQGLANGITNTTLNTIATVRVPNSILASFSGAQSTTWQVAMTVGMAMLFAVMEAGGADNAASYNSAFGVGVGFSALAFAMALYLGYLLDHSPEDLMYPEDESTDELLAAALKLPAIIIDAPPATTATIAILPSDHSSKQKVVEMIELAPLAPASLISDADEGSPSSGRSHNVDDKARLLQENDD